MDAELKSYLDSKFAEVILRFSEVESELREVRSGMKSEFQAVRSEIEQLETKLLTEFWKWGRASDSRIRRVEHSDNIAADRLANIEERVFTLERRMAGGKE